MADVAFHDGVESQLSQADKDGLAAFQAVLSAPPTKDALKARAAAARYHLQIGSTTINGMQVATDPASCGNLTGAALGAQINPNISMPWKMADGSFVTLSGAQIVALAQAVMGYVAGLYGREQAVGVQIDAGSIATFAQVDAAFAAP